jgi:hypothetical protein
MQRMAELCGALLGDAWGWLRVAMDALETKVRTHKSALPVPPSPP